MPGADVPQFRVPEEGEPIPSVDPAELRRNWSKPSWTCEASQAASSRGVDYGAVMSRARMIRALAGFQHGQLLAPWRHGEQLDDAVFRVAATFPMRELPDRVYKIAGDERFGFDPDTFVRRLIEETGISHVWEPIPTRIDEGGWSFSFCWGSFKGQAPRDHQGPFGDEREAKHQAREVLWDAWSKYFHLQPSEQVDEETYARLVANLFADFVIDNVDLAQQLTSLFSGKGEGAKPFAILTELERRAKLRKP